MADRNSAGITGKAGKNVQKIFKPEGIGHYRPSFDTPLTLDEQRKYNKLPKDTLLTLPKGAVVENTLSRKEIKQMQLRRVLDRQRTLARGANIIRRTTLGKNG